LDTNAIFSIFEFSINLESELARLLGAYKILIPIAVINEIKSIMKKGKGKQRILAKPALQFIKHYPVLRHDQYDDADNALLYEAVKENAVVVTNDKELRKRLQKKKVSCIFIRGKQQLVIDQ
jgi:rRNA-processing protein FCF1